MSTSQSAPPMTAGQLAQTTTRWLFKSEPDTRLEKGKDISFGIDKFEQLGVSSWDFSGNLKFLFPVGGLLVIF